MNSQRGVKRPPQIFKEQVDKEIMLDDIRLNMRSNWGLFDDHL